MGEAGYQQGESEDYDRDYAVDLAKLTAYLTATQPKAARALDLDQESPKRTQFLNRLQGEIARLGVIDVLRRAAGTPAPTAEGRRNSDY